MGIVSELQEEVIQKIVNKQVNTSWYHRKVDETPLKPTMKAPHPENELNRKRMEAYKSTIEK
jgi:hypothetical protein